MTEAAKPLDIQQLLSGEGPERAGPGARRALVLGGGVIAGLAIAAFVVLMLVIGERRQDLVAAVKNRVEIVASGRADALSTWVNGMAKLADPFVHSHLFRLFAAEVDLRPPGGGLSAALTDQLPYMQVALTDFVNQSGLSGAYLVGRDGRAYLASVGSPTLGSAQRDAVRRVFDEGERVIRPLRTTPAGLGLDILLPVGPPQPTPGGGTGTVGVLVLSVPATARISAALAPTPLTSEGEATRLLQVHAGGAEEVLPTGTPTLRPVPSANAPEAPVPLPFGGRMGIAANDPVFSVGVIVPGTPWLVVQEYGRVQALAPLDLFRDVGIGLTVLGVLVMAAAFAAVWLRQSGVFNRALAGQYRDLASRIHAQRRILASVTDTIQELIALKDSDGNYVYVNPAFAEAVGRPADGIIGRDDVAVFGVDAARRLRLSDDRVRDTGQSVDENTRIILGASPRTLQISKTPLADDDGTLVGIVSVARDITEIIEHQRRKERSVQQMVSVLVYAVESSDPYLAGHSERLAEIAAGMARAMSLPEDVVGTVEIAAILSQVGKLAVPREIVGKESRLSPDEEKVMRTHVIKAGEILRNMDFDLPVLDALTQMYERLDGSGYPANLRGSEISTAALILGIADIFVARTSPRSYRDAISPEEILPIFESYPEKYDPAVVDALRASMPPVPPAPRHKAPRRRTMAVADIPSE